MSDENEEGEINEMQQRIFDALKENCVSAVVSIQVHPEFPATTHYFGNYEACRSMAQKVWPDFSEQTGEDDGTSWITVDMTEDDDMEEGDEWKEEEDE